MRTVDAVLFDKTGTLTEGRHVVTDVVAVEGDHAELLRLAAAVEADSEHPLGRAIVAAAARRCAVGVGLPVADRPGRRSARRHEPLRGRRPESVARARLDVPAALEEADEWNTRGASVLYVVRDDEVVGAIALEDEVRPEARAGSRSCTSSGSKPVVMITGRRAATSAERVAAEVGVDETFAEVLPVDKEHAVAELQARGLSVAMVGDGVNDAPALARADVGIAIGAGTDVAIESAGVVLASSDPRGVIGIIRLSRASYRKMLQNLAWAAGYNLVAIPLAAGVLEPWGITLPPAVGAILMSLSTIIVAANAQLLRRLDLRPG